MSDENKQANPFAPYNENVSGPYVEPVEEPVEELIEEPVEEPIVEPVVEPIEEPVEEPIEEVVEEEIESTEPVVEPEDIIIDEWDTTPVIEAETNTEVDYTALGTELGFEVTSKESLVTKVKELSEQASIDPLARVPEQLKKAIDLAQKGGDYLRFLGVTDVDYSKIDDRTLLENDLAQHFQDETGVVDKEALQDYMESIDEVDLGIRAKQLKSQLIYAQAQESDKLQMEASQRQAVAEQDLKRVIKSVDEIRGFKLNPNHKKMLFDGISSGDMIAEMFYGKDGQLDFDKAVKIYFDYKYGDKANTVLRQRANTAAKKQVLKELGNVNVEVGADGLPDVTPKVRTSQDDLRDHLTSGAAMNR